VLHPRLSGLWWGSLLLHDFMTAEGRFPIHPFCLCLSCSVLSRTGVSSFVELDTYLSYPRRLSCEPFAIGSTRGGTIFLTGLSAI
jgi:hypothetical protein